MKRWVWLLLAAFCTALAQVQPVRVEAMPAACDCCETADACGMPDCAMPPAQAQPSAVQLATVQQAQPIAMRRVSSFRADFVLPLAPRLVDVTSGDLAPRFAVAPAVLPLFAAHCSRLI